MQKSRLQLAMIWNRERRACAAWMAQANVAAALTNFLVADGREGASSIASRNARDVTHRGLLSDGNAVVNLAGRIGNHLAVGEHVVDGECDRFLDVGECLLDGLPLAVASGKCGHDHHVAAVTVGFENDVVGSFAHNSVILPQPVVDGHPGTSVTG